MSEQPARVGQDGCAVLEAQALHRSGAPTCGPEGAPISHGHRVRWVCNRLAAAEEDIQRRIDAEAAAWAVLVDAGVCRTRADGSAVSLADAVAVLAAKGKES